MRAFLFSISLLALFSTPLAAQPASDQTDEAAFLHQLAPLRPPGEGEEPVKCGTGMMIDLREAARASKTAKVVERPALPESFVTSDGRFRIHYTTTGDDAVDPTSTNGLGIPDFVYETALAAGRSHRLLVDTLGYHPPADDQGADGNEFDIYIVNLDPGLYGYTDPEEPAPGGIGRFTCYLVVDNDFLENNYFTHGLDALRVTVAHEYFHAVQFNYRYREEDRYFFETSSTWFEDMAYDEVNDYLGYLRRYFQEPFRPLNTQDNRHEYGNGIWLHYLAKRFDVLIVRQIWEQIEETPSLTATSQVLADRVSTFSETIAEFFRWMYFTGYRADPATYFPEGATYPLVAVDRRQITQPVIADSLPNLSARFYRFDAVAQALSITHVSNDQPGRWRLTTINGTSQLNYLSQESIGGAPLCVQPATAADTLIVIVNNTSLPAMPGLQYYYRYSLLLASGCAVSDNRLFPPRPNPFLPGAGDNLIVPLLLTKSSQVELFIVREDGRRMRRIDLGLRRAGVEEIPWDGRDDDGEAVASGIYILQVIAGGFQETAKVAVIQR